MTTPMTASLFLVKVRSTSCSDAALLVYLAPFRLRVGALGSRPRAGSRRPFQ